MKFTRVNEDFALGIVEFHNKYPDFENKDEELSEELINDALTAVSDDYISLKIDFMHKIYNIYMCLLMDYINKKENENTYEIFWPRYLIKSIIYLKESFYLNYFNLEELCQETYSNLYESNSNYLPKNMPEEFKAEHILDLEYYKNIFKNWAEKDLEFNKFVDSIKGVY